MQELDVDEWISRTNGADEREKIRENVRMGAGRGAWGR
jgi:hypothetical protein